MGESWTPAGRSVRWLGGLQHAAASALACSTQQRTQPRAPHQGHGPSQTQACPPGGALVAQARRAVHGPPRCARGAELLPRCELGPPRCARAPPARRRGCRARGDEDLLPSPTMMGEARRPASRGVVWDLAWEGVGRPHPTSARSDTVGSSHSPSARLPRPWRCGRAI